MQAFPGSNLGESQATVKQPRVSTVEGLVTDDRGRVGRARTARRAALAALLALILAGLTGVLGVRTAESSARASGYALTVTYPSVARPGLAIEWAVEISRAGGFDGPVRVATSSTYLAMFDENGLDPDPAAATADDREVFWEFNPPPGETLTISFDARIEPGMQWGSRGRTRVLDEQGRTIVAVTYRTWVMP